MDLVEALEDAGERLGRALVEQVLANARVEGIAAERDAILRSVAP